MRWKCRVSLYCADPGIFTLCCIKAAPHPFDSLLAELGAIIRIIVCKLLKSLFGHFCVFFFLVGESRGSMFSIIKSYF